MAASGPAIRMNTGASPRALSIIVMPHQVGVFPLILTNNSLIRTETSLPLPYTIRIVRYMHKTRCSGNSNPTQPPAQGGRKL